MASITFDHVTKSYEDGTTAVNGMDLEIRDGEFLILVGPSGCGKSTALRMIAGLEDISSGEMRIGDRVVNDAAPKDRDIAMVFQNYALYPHMSVRDNMAFALKLAGADKAEIDKRVGEAAKTLDLEPYLERKPSQLSGGQRQRVAMGRAIVREPAAFLMDEPLSNLDAKLRTQTRTQIAALQQRLGTTTVYVTHDQTEAMTLGDRVAVMRAGELQQVGTPRELYERPVNLFVAGFIGSPSMNFLPGRVEGDQVAFGLGSVPLPAGVQASGDVIVGLRPEHFEDARFAPDGHRWVPFRASIEVLESLGSELYAHFDVGGGSARSEHLDDLARDAGMDDLPGAEDGSRVVARITAESDVQQGQEVDLVLDADRVVLFDPDGGAALAGRRGTPSSLTKG